MRVCLPVALSILMTACKPNVRIGEVAAEDSQQRSSRLQEMALFETQAEAALTRNVTPFDSDLAAREAYLESFHRGYRLAIGGTHGTCCISDVPHRQAIVRGWYHGQWAGGRAWSSNHLGKVE
jgi:hypothetical protein